MKKKWLALVLAGVLCLNFTGCNTNDNSNDSNSDYSAADALAEYKESKGKGNNKKETEDSKEEKDSKKDKESKEDKDSDNSSDLYLTNEKTKGYTEITMFRSKFMVPDSIVESGKGLDDIVRFMNEEGTYDVKAQFGYDCFSEDDIEDVADNIEKYYLENYDIVVDIDTDDCLADTEDTKQKYIFPSVDFGGYDGSIAYLCDMGADVLFYIIEDGDVFTDKEKDIMLKSLDVYDGDEYTYATDLDSELVELDPIEDDETEEEQDEDESEVENNDDDASELNLDNPLYAFEMTVNGDKLKLPMWFTDLEEAGWEFDGDREEMVPANTRYFVEYWEKGDTEIVTSIVNFGSSAAPYSECIITEMEISAYKNDDENEIELPLGIKLYESDYDDVIKAYGEADDTFEGTYSIKLTYEHDYEHKVELSFDVETKILKNANIKCQEMLEGVNTEMDDIRPEILDTYKEPSKLSEDLLDVTFELDGTVYQLPCPMEKFLEDGWKFDEDEAIIVSPSAQEYCKIVKGDLEARVWLKNPIQDAIYAEYSYVVEIEVSKFDGSDFPMTIGNGISIGDAMTPDEVIDKFEGMEVNPHLDDDTLKHIYVDCTDEIEYSVVTKNGKVCQITMENNVRFNK